MPPFPFLSLPLELRESIYSLYFKPSDRLIRNETLEKLGFFGGVYDFDFKLYKVNKQVYREAKVVWKRENVFVKIATPWPSAGMYRVYLMSEDGREDGTCEWSLFFEDAIDLISCKRSWAKKSLVIVNHISSEGLVPIVCTDQRADAFTSHHALVQITAPFHQAVPEHTVVVLLDDLHLFTQTWYYSALSYPMLNDRLSTSFTLLDSCSNSHQSSISIPLQRRLLLPFEKIKGLYHMEVNGYAPEVEAELERRMAIPIPTLIECCESAASLMEKGDQIITSNNPQEALDCYLQAFHAIHILIHGRTRRVLADVFFHEGMETGRFAGQTGITVRVVLRLKLVSRCILAYLKLAQWDEAAFWGMRTIRIMRDGMDIEFEDFLNEFIGGEDVGMIYVRTGVAFWKMESKGQEVMGYDGEGSERIWGLARKYLKGRRKDGVRSELRGFAVPEEAVAMFTDEEKEGSMVARDGSDEE
jgi:hypothetical protein